jgi:hypothetical protein
LAFGGLYPVNIICYQRVVYVGQFTPSLSATFVDSKDKRKKLQERVKGLRYDKQNTQLS